MATNSDGTCPGGAEQCSKHLPGYTVRAAAPFASSSEASRMLLQQYGPLKMRPFHTDPPAKNITAVADIVSRRDIAGVWAATFSRSQRYRC